MLPEISESAILGQQSLLCICDKVVLVTTNTTSLFPQEPTSPENMFNEGIGNLKNIAVAGKNNILTTF